MEQKLGLYIHIPFCENICHYCDFSKTARFDPDLIKAYFKKLLQHIALAKQEGIFSKVQKLTSVNLGGGTPGLFSHEYEALFSELSSYLSEDAEISLEANPNNLTQEKLAFWKELGFNRLSIGIQTFHPHHLRSLKRDHSKDKALEAVELAHRWISNLNGDLIYGLENQTLKEWDQDLDIFLNLPFGHASFYQLTHHERTPIGRKVLRGKVPALEDDLIIQMYDKAQEKMAVKGFLQEEVSNWYRPAYPAKHNSLYWTQGFYLGLGVGSCGFLPLGSLGLRYKTEDRIMAYLKSEDQDFLNLLKGRCDGETSFVIDHRPDPDSWFMEAITCGLRYEKGLDLQKIYEVTGFVYKGSYEHNILWEDSGFLKLNPREWIREESWAIKVLNDFKKEKTF